jgi:hypothetical protein
VPRWNAWTRVQPFQVEEEDPSTPRPVRLSGPSAQKGARVRITLGNVEVEETVTDARGSTIYVQLERKD